MKTNTSKFFTFVAVALVSSIVTLLITLSVTSATARQQQFTGNENHVILLDQAVKLIQNYQASPHVPSMRGGFFSRSIFEKILAQNGCVGVRYYYAQKDDGSSTIVLVGVDTMANDMTSGILGDITVPCPPFCGTSVLNK